MKMTRPLLALSVALFAVAIVGWNLRRGQDQVPTGPVRANEVPLKGFEPQTPDAVIAGDPDAAMRQLRQLMNALRANNWMPNPRKVPLSLQILPDGKFAECLAFRTGPNVAFPSAPIMQPDDYMPEYEPIAFYTEIYARENRAYYKGDRSVSHPTGYYIVGWKDGRIEKVPIMQLREFTSRNTHVTSGQVCFPGMAEYATAKPYSMIIDAAK